MKMDLKQTLDSYQARRGEFRVVDVPEAHFLMVDGHGDPNTSKAYAEAIEALYPVAYALKFTSKRELGRDYVVMPLEALWWAADMSSFTTARDKNAWSWTLMMLVPEWITAQMYDFAVAQIAAKHPQARLDQVRLESFHEGLCVQTLHVGSYEDEGPVLLRMHEEFIPGAGLKLTGKHHEIYLSDPRRVEPSKLRTIMRQPVAPA